MRTRGLSNYRAIDASRFASLTAALFAFACSDGASVEVPADPAGALEGVGEPVHAPSEAPAGYTLLGRLAASDYATADESLAWERAERSRAEARRLAGSEEEDPLAKLSRSELAEAFRGVTLMPDGSEYWEDAPNWKVADTILAARGAAARGAEEVLEPTPGGGHTLGDVPEELQGYMIFGDDGRVRIRSNTTYPFAPQGRITQGNHACTVTMIGPSTGLTAAHCVHTGTAWLPAGHVRLGMDSADANPEPFGRESCYVRTVPTQWAANNTSVHYDFAVIDFWGGNCRRTPGNQTGWLGVWAAQDGHYGSMSTLNLYGYPVNLDDQGDTCPPGTCFSPTIWGTGSNWFGVKSSLEMKHRADATGAQSGAGIYVIDSGDRYIVGIHRGAVWDLFHDGWHNHGRRVDPTLLTLIENWSTWERDGASVGHPWEP